MDENNPLFDLCKIKIELIFLNENFSNFHNYETELIFYLNKYLWKIKNDTQNININKTEETNIFYYFEFYSKYFDIKSANISDTNLLSNRTDFYCNLLFIFDKEDFSKNEERIMDIIKILSSRNTPKELSHLLIICNENFDSSYFEDILDENSFDIINIWENNNDIKKNRQKFEKALKKIIIKYRINALNQKIDVKNNQENIKIEKNVEILDAHIKLGNYQKSIKYLEELNNKINVPKELCIFKECKILINFLIDFNNNYNSIDENENKNEFKYNKEIENDYLSIIEEYKNINQIFLMINAYIKLLYYLSYFNGIEIKQKISEIIFNLIYEINDESKLQIVSNITFLVYLNLSHIYNKIKFKRKFFFSLFKAYIDYSNKNKKNENIIYLDILIKNLEKNFSLINNKNNIPNYYNYNYDTFLQLANIIKKSHYNPMNFIYKDKNNKIIENIREIDDINKGSLYISNILEGYHQIFHHILWEEIQKEIYDNLMKYYKGIKNYDKTILYSLELLQACYNKLSTDKQNELINVIQKKSSKVKYINSYNVVNIPIIYKIIPQLSHIKFDYEENDVNDEKDDLFIYNPWNKKKENICYYWTLNSIQTIIFILYNPLEVEICLSQFQLIYNCKAKRNNNDNNLFNFIPCSISIPPKQKFEFKFKFKPLVEEIFDIIGIEYYFEGAKIKQYLKNDGNGIFYRYKNYIENLFNSKIKDNILLTDIRIFPEIPLVKLIPLNIELIEDSPLILFLFQKYTFNFDIFNLSDKPIKQINMAIYAYKKADYKILLYEEILKGENNIY